MMPAPTPRGVEGDDFPRIGRQPQHGADRGGGEYDNGPTDELAMVAGRDEPGRAARSARPLNGALAGAELADRLKHSWIAAGRPPMDELGDLVGYSKVTIAKVLSGQMPPAWRLVRKLGSVLGVPAATVSESWHPLWIAADDYRRARPYSGPPLIDGQPPGWACESCGAWVVNTDLHNAWHTRWEPGLPPTPVDGSVDWASLRDSLPRREEQAHRDELARRQRTARPEE